MSVEIPLSQGFVTIVDDEDAERVRAAGKWSAMRTGDLVYARRTVSRPGGRQTSLLLHKFLTGYPETDHRNGNGLDNRRANLRPATSADNKRNQGLRSTNTSGFKGVGWHKASGRWRAYITVDGKQLSLGGHPTAAAAARAYDAAAREHFGEFARPNFPEAP